jgi:hypothetical protein
MDEARTGEATGVVAGLLRLLALLWVLARVAVFVALGLSLFIVAFLGYFTLPFLFLGVALLVLAIGRGRLIARRARRRRGARQ